MSVPLDKDTLWRREFPKWPVRWWKARKVINALGGLYLSLVGGFLAAIVSGAGMTLGFVLVKELLIKLGYW